MEPITYAQRQVASNLKVLSIFYWISGGMTALGSCVGFIYVAMGILFAAAPAASQNAQGAQGAAATAGGIVAFIGFVIIIFILGIASLSFMTARNLTQHKGYTLCMVVAGLHCLNIPLGVILGVFTFVNLAKQEAKELFGLAPMPQPEATHVPSHPAAPPHARPTTSASHPPPVPPSEDDNPYAGV